MDCPACFSPETRKIATYTKPGYAFLRCGECGVIFAEPMKAGSKEWYENHDHYAPPFEPKDNKPFYEEEFLARKLHMGRNKLLNIGCGYNLFLKKLQESGYDVTGVDLNEQVIKFTREKVGIDKAYAIAIDDFIAGFSGDKFDFIIFFEVLEHLEKPGEFLRSLNRIIAADGKIIFSMPNRQRLLPQTHWADYPPHHLTRWSRQAVRLVLEKNGFSVEDTSISPISAEQLLYALGFDFWTEALEKYTRGCKEHAAACLLYRMLFRLRVVFYNLLAIVLRPLLPLKGTYLFTIAKLKEPG